MTDNRNTILAVILSGLVLIAWQYFYNVPQMEKQRAQSQTQAELQKATPQSAPGATTPQSGSAPAPGAATPATTQPASAAPVISRDAAIAAAPRVKIDTPRVSGSISLKGARIDDISLVKYPRHRRSRLARDRAVLALADRQPLLCGIRLGPRDRLDRAAPGRNHDVATGRFRRANADEPSDAEI